MKSPGHSHRITVNASKQEVFKALTTIEGLKSWYANEIEARPDHAGKIASGSEVTFAFSEHEPAFLWKITELKPDSSVRWHCEAGPGQAKGTETLIQLSEKDGGKTVVNLDHEGFREPNDEKLKTCNTYWGSLLGHLKDYVETGQARPTFR
jgi:uncharacterized protein YndB with AHSA1/START domain